jgi:hypothetical protein
MKNPRWVNNYRLQYWLYAVLNHEFGTEVKMERDSLHSRYSVNRHGFNVRTNRTPLATARRLFIARLERAGYKISSESTRSMLVMQKSVTRLTKHEDQYIAIRDIQDGKFYVNGSSSLR